MSREDAALIAGVVVGVVVGVLLLSLMAKPASVGEENVRREAVRVGVAKYVADQHGASSFTWIIPAEVGK